LPIPRVICRAHPQAGMCERFTQHYTWPELAGFYRLMQPAPNLWPHYNIAPTDTIDVVIRRGGDRELLRMRWGLIPAWWKKTAREARPAFDARADTVATHPTFRDSFWRRRCIIPASGYYEWRDTASSRQPYYITAVDGGVLSFAGLWDEWKDIETGAAVKSVTIIVAKANALTR
jgi:putative SOS response-associated peptidase YedK